MRKLLSVDHNYSVKELVGHRSGAKHCYEVLFRQSPCPDCPLESVLKDRTGRGITTQWEGDGDKDRTARQFLQVASPNAPNTILELITEEEELHPAAFIKEALFLIEKHINACRSLFFLKVRSSRHETKMFAREKEHVHDTLCNNFYILEIPPTTLLCLPRKELSEDKASEHAKTLQASVHPHTSVLVVEADLRILQSLQLSGPTLKTLVDLSQLPGVRPKKYQTSQPGLQPSAAIPASSSLNNGQAVAQSLRELVSTGENAAALFFAEFVRGITPNRASDVVNKEAALVAQIHDFEFLLRLVGQELLRLRDERAHETRGYSSFKKYCASLGLSPDTAQTFMQIALQPHHLLMVEHEYRNTGKHRKNPPAVLDPLTLILKQSNTLKKKTFLGASRRTTGELNKRE